MATKKTHNKQEVRQQLNDQTDSAKSDFGKIQVEAQSLRDDLAMLKVERDATQRSLMDIDKLIRETRMKYEQALERQNQAQSEISAATGSLMALGAI